MLTPKMQKLEQDWHWYCKQAGNYALIPKSVDDLQDIFEQRNYLLPRINRYYGFFGKLNTPENQKFKDPDYRNLRSSFIGYRI